MGQRLIDAEALGIGKAKREAFVVPEIADGWNAVIDIIAHAPTVDAVPVVRCEKCRKFKTYECPMAATAGYSDFCSYGERKEDTPHEQA